MIYSLKGNITHVGKDFIVISVHDIGYQVFVANTLNFQKNDENIILYTYQVTREDEQYLIGFNNLLEKQAFMSLINVKGIGPKLAINALSMTTPDMLMKAIASNNVAYLKRLPGIGQKAASQIILDLKGQLTGEKGNPEQYEDVKQALKQLGFKNTQIENVLAQINIENATNEEILALALKNLRKK